LLPSFDPVAGFGGKRRETESHGETR